MEKYNLPLERQILVYYADLAILLIRVFQLLPKTDNHIHHLELVFLSRSDII